MAAKDDFCVDNSDDFDYDDDRNLCQPPKFKRKRPSSSSSFHQDSSSSNSPGSCSARRESTQHVPSVSEWTTKTLDKFGIVFEDNPISIDEFTQTIQAHHVCEKTVPDFYSSLNVLSKRGLAFSLEVPENEASKSLDKQADSMKKVREILSNFDAFINDVLEEEDNELGKEQRNKAMFFVWSYSVRSFLNYYKKFLEMMNSSMTECWFAIQDKELHLRELFMVFSRIFFLEPELGNKVVKRFIIGTKVVSGSPDIRFTCTNPLQRRVLLMLTEAKKSESWGEKKPFEWRNSGHSSDSSSETDPKVGNFIQRIVDAHDLGQHGGKLLLELSSSVFAPTMVVGCICMGTEVIFTYLETKEAHLNKITYDGRCDGEISYIRYTEPLNYLIEEDRNKCIDLFFLLGFMQTSGYENLFPDPPKN